MPFRLVHRPFFAWNRGAAMLLAASRDEEAWVRKAAALAIVAGLAGCAPRPAPQAAPPPAPAIATAPKLPSAPPQAPDWRDLPLSAGDWTYSAAPEGSRALFGGGVFTLRCDATQHRIELARIAAGAGTMTVTTSYGMRSLPLAAEGVARLAAADPLFDQMAFSRGRFTIEVEGLERLVIPAWPEAARVVEDCRA
ncbi:MAG: hypothetical protein QOH86_13 [Sphingomonadales bacterium]|jgi:hypothetical protein|nr:hypothetical protein [Sphingomonadales bacterium]